MKNIQSHAPMKLTLSKGETMLIERRRSGRSQEEVGAEIGVSQNTVSKWELDKREIPVERLPGELGTLSGGERAFIMRRRIGKSIRYMASAMGVSHPTIIRWERGSGHKSYETKLVKLTEETNA